MIPTNDTDNKMIGWCLGAFVAGAFVGALLVAPMIERMKKKGKKPETTPAKT